MSNEIDIKDIYQIKELTKYQSKFDENTKLISQEVIGAGSDFNAVYTNCKFNEFKTESYGNCYFVNCTFPDDPSITEKIFLDRKNVYKNCLLNFSGIISKIMDYGSGLTPLINSINKLLNDGGHSEQIFDVGKTQNKNNRSRIGAI